MSDEQNNSQQPSETPSNTPADQKVESPSPEKPSDPSTLKQADKPDENAGASADAGADAPSDADKKPDDGAAGKPDDKTNGDEKAKDGDPDKDGEDKAKSVPDAYEFKLSDGYTIDEPAREAVTKWAKENGLSQEALNSAIKLHEQQQSKAAEVYRGVVSGWEKRSFDSPDIAKGDKDTQSRIIAEGNAVVDRIFPDSDPDAKEFKELVLETYGIGHHPGFIKAMLKLKGAVSDDGFPAGQGTQNKKDIPLHERMWPNGGKGVEIKTVR